MTESGADSTNAGYTTQSALGAGGSWQAFGGSASASSSGFTQSAYSASGGYTRPLLGGSIQGTWQDGGGADSFYNADTLSTLDSYSGWTTTGSGSGSDDASGSWSYSGSGSFSQSSSSGDAANGSDSYMSGDASEGFGEGWTYHDATQSALSSDGSVTGADNAFGLWKRLRLGQLCGQWRLRRLVEFGRLRRRQRHVQLFARRLGPDRRGVAAGAVVGGLHPHGRAGRDDHGGGRLGEQPGQRRRHGLR